MRRAGHKAANHVATCRVKESSRVRDKMAPERRRRAHMSSPHKAAITAGERGQKVGAGRRSERKRPHRGINICEAPCGRRSHPEQSLQDQDPESAPGHLSRKNRDRLKHPSDRIIPASHRLHQFTTDSTSSPPVHHRLHQFTTDSTSSPQTPPVHHQFTTDSTSSPLTPPVHHQFTTDSTSSPQTPPVHHQFTTDSTSSPLHQFTTDSTSSPLTPPVHH
ncbi:uncharacterized protein V6R79_005074 [Siganus canaliculatus]